MRCRTGDTYYHNVLTGNTTWDIPDDMAWEKHFDEQAGQYAPLLAVCCPTCFVPLLAELPY
jgi:hypothetical protein